MISELPGLVIVSECRQGVIGLYSPLAGERQVRSDNALSMLVVLLVLGSSEVRAGGARVQKRPCPVSVLTARDKRPGEVAAVRQLRFGVGADPRLVLGPDSLRLVDTDDSEHHPRVFIEDQRTGSRDDIVGQSASRPSWSPDGRYVACVVYVSQQQPYQLSVIDRRTRRRIDIDARLAADEYRWSPNSRWIAVEGVERATNHVGLSVYDLVRRSLRRVSTTRAFGSYGLSWSPDSKFLAFTEPSSVDEDETVLAADVWIAPTSTWLPCRVRATADEVESQPEWLSDAALLVKSVPRSAPHAAGRETVLELRHQIRGKP